MRPERRTTSQLLTVTMGPDDGTGYAEACAVDATTIDAAAIGREAAGKARASARPVDIEPGEYPVVAGLFVPGGRRFALLAEELGHHVEEGQDCHGREHQADADQRLRGPGRHGRALAVPAPRR